MTLLKVRLDDARRTFEAGASADLAEVIRASVAAIGLLPVPAAYVIDQSGRIALSYIDPDFTTRLEPADIIVALRCLRDRPSKLYSRPPKEQ